MSKRKQTKEQRQKQVISRLTNENAFLRVEIKKRDKRIDVLEEKLEKALLYIEELQKYVFRGKKKNKDKDNDDDDKNDKSGDGSGSPNKRSKASYRRPVPNNDEVTNTEEHLISHCPDCNTELFKIKLLEFFEEDIIPMIEWFQKLKKVTKIIIATGYCSQCKKRVSTIPIPKQKVSIGKNIKQLVVFQYTVMQLSYSQIKDFLESHIHFKISDGETTNALAEQALKLKPAFDDLIKSIRESPGVQMDETSYNIAFHNEFSGNYAWTMTSIEKDNPNTVFVLGKNRGKRNAEKLLGNNYKGIGVTDDYNGYTNIFEIGKHALCWAHPKRKFKDLKNSNSLEEKKKKACKEFYNNFVEIYQKIAKVNQADFNKQERTKAKEILMPELEKILKPNKNDPVKLRTFKETMFKKRERYFVCITEPNVPPDNNKAERSLRHLVIKRKKSFGSKTPKGAETMSILYSVVMSLWWRSKSNFFNVYDEALA